MLASVPLLLLVHVAWFLDPGGTKTGSSTSALIFVFLLVYAFILGAAGYGIGWWWGGRTGDPGA